MPDLGDTHVSASDTCPVDVRRRRWLLAGLAVVGIGLFLLLLVLVKHDWGPLVSLDQAGRDGLHSYFVDHTNQVRALKGVSRAGTAPVYVVIFAFVVGWLLHGRRLRDAAFVLVTVLLGSFLSPTIKALVERERPAVADPVGSAGGYSFPSGHATQAMTVALVLLVVLLPAVRSRRRRQLLVALATFCVVAIGFSRIGLGVHFVTDVIAGYVLAASWVALTLALLAPSALSSRSWPIR